MKKANELTNESIIILLSILLTGCQFSNQKSKTGDLPIIDLSKNYPSKEIHLQDIADIEYIPLETSDEILLSRNIILSYVSDKYIVIYEYQQGDIFIFSREGKIISHFNRRGQGP